MANTKIVDASKISADVAGTSLAVPCVVHASDLQVGDLVIVKVAPTNTPSEYVPHGQNTIIRGGGGGSVVIDMPTGISYYLSVSFVASPNRDSSATGATVYLMTA